MVPCTAIDNPGQLDASPCTVSRRKTKFRKFFRTALADNIQIDNLHLGFLGTDHCNIEFGKQQHETHGLQASMRSGDAVQSHAENEPKLIYPNTN
jgi:hypothetical protein